MENKEMSDSITAKESLDKMLLSVEIVLALVTLFSFIIIWGVSLYVIYVMEIYVLPIICMVLSFVMLIISSMVCMWIEQKAGYYHCQKCNHKYVPTFNQSVWAPHIFRTKYMKCPNCKKLSWKKKVLK